MEILLGKADALLFSTGPTLHFWLLTWEMDEVQELHIPYPSFLTYDMENSDYMISEVTPSSKMCVGTIYRV